MSKKQKATRRLTPKRILGMVAKTVLAILVVVFMGAHSLSFFTFIFSADKFYYAYLGFALTSGGVVLYLVVLKTEAQEMSDMQKFVIISMMIVSVLGEAATAFFGMQIEAWEKANYALLPSELELMIYAVTGLGFLHGIAWIAYFSWDEIAEAFGDHDGDGVPNIVDKDYRKGKKAYAKDEKQEKLDDSKNA